MELTDKEIQDLLAGKCTSLEAKSIVDALEGNGETLSRYFNQDEWEQFTTGQKLSKEDLDRALMVIHSKVETEVKIYRRPIFYIPAAAAAAAIIFFVGVGFWKTINNKDGVSKAAIADAPTAIVISDTNTSGFTKQINLEDGSSVELTPKSIVRYAKHFPSNQRVVELEGNAFFHVAKDKNRPFEVRSSGFSTIALGTSFRVTAMPSEKQVTVQLYTGKVMVKKTNNDALFQYTVLLPNQQLTINTASLTSEMSLMKPNSNLASMEKEKTTKQQIVWEKYISSTQIRFAGTPLEVVMQVLEHHYGVNIKYNKEQLSGFVFTGTFKSNDEVKAILFTIASVNNLRLLNKNGTHFKITR